MPDIADVPIVDTLEHLARQRLEYARIRPELFWPWRQPCTVKTLLVTDGGSTSVTGTSACPPSSTSS